MTVHLIKLCVGIDSVDQLREEQARRLDALRRQGREPVLIHWTRHAPHRAEEVLDGGSLYWVIHGAVAARQPLLGIERRDGVEGEKRCALILSPELIETVPVHWRPFQGWRYLDPVEAPPDLREHDDMPPEMARDLRLLGLI
ncbi:MAG: hypothetical protein CMM50_05120 [Rhodospirillaceae bacterium]|nr:hypothetical protein [Rhodospirillaceae bacterium]